jgi:hypothetical protein
MKVKQVLTVALVSLGSMFGTSAALAGPMAGVTGFGDGLESTRTTQTAIVAGINFFDPFNGVGQSTMGPCQGDFFVDRALPAGWHRGERFIVRRTEHARVHGAAASTSSVTTGPVLNQRSTRRLSLQNAPPRTSAQTPTDVRFATGYVNDQCGTFRDTLRSLSIRTFGQGTCLDTDGRQASRCNGGSVGWQLWPSRSSATASGAYGSWCPVRWRWLAFSVPWNPVAAITVASRLRS